MTREGEDDQQSREDMVDLDGKQRVKGGMNRRDLIINKTRPERGLVQMHAHKQGNAYRTAFWGRVSHFCWENNTIRRFCEMSVH